MIKCKHLALHWSKQLPTSRLSSVSPSASLHLLFVCVPPLCHSHMICLSLHVTNGNASLTQTQQELFIFPINLFGVTAVVVAASFFIFYCELVTQISEQVLWNLLDFIFVKTIIPLSQQVYVTTTWSCCRARVQNCQTGRTTWATWGCQLSAHGCLKCMESVDKLRSHDDTENEQI